MDRTVMGALALLAAATVGYVLYDAAKDEPSVESRVNAVVQAALASQMDKTASPHDLKPGIIATLRGEMKVDEYITRVVTNALVDEERRRMPLERKIPFVSA